MSLNPLIPQSEIDFRISALQSIIASNGIDAMLVSNNANLYYTSGRVFNGYTYIPASGNATYFVRRPVGLSADNVIYIHKPEQIAEYIDLTKISNIGLELDNTPYSVVMRLSKAFNGIEVKNISGVLRQARSVKTQFEINCLIESGLKHAHVYSQIPSLFKDGMTDLQLQIEIERLLRLKGCLGQFRINGDSMEIFMGNLICGENADNPSPYDFAMGGAGLNMSLPVGCNGSLIQSGMTVMVDLNGNFTGYMTDMTRVFSYGMPSDLAIAAHNCSRRIVKELADMGKPGVEAKTLYERAITIAAEEHLDKYFMGHKQKAGFIGHGVGIEINESPVIAPRSRDILQIGNVIALEPKFVIPQVGAVGVENTYVITDSGMLLITHAPEEIIPFN